MDPAEALRQLKETNPDKDENTLWWKVDRAKYYEETGKSAGSGTYYRLRDAIAEGKSAGIKEAVNQLKAHGTEAKNIKSWLTSEYKKAYLAASGSEKVQIKNSLIMAYKALGISENDANEIINKWK
jgi:DNA polymerase III delta subunit